MPIRQPKSTGPLTTSTTPAAILTVTSGQTWQVRQISICNNTGVPAGVTISKGSPTGANFFRSSAKLLAAGDRDVVWGPITLVGGESLWAQSSTAASNNLLVDVEFDNLI